MEAQGHHPDENSATFRRMGAGMRGRHLSSEAEQEEVASRRSSGVGAKEERNVLSKSSRPAQSSVCAVSNEPAEDRRGATEASFEGRVQRRKEQRTHDARKEEETRE